jgi:hypothetical protein
MEIRDRPLMKTQLQQILGMDLLLLNLVRNIDNRYYSMDYNKYPKKLESQLIEVVDYQSLTISVIIEVLHPSPKIIHSLKYHYPYQRMLIKGMKNLVSSLYPK